MEKKKKPEFQEKRIDGYPPITKMITALVALGALELGGYGEKFYPNKQNLCPEKVSEQIKKQRKDMKWSCKKAMDAVSLGW